MRSRMTLLLLPLAVLAYVAAFSLFGPLIPVNSGIGWDGAKYAAVVRNWPTGIYALSQYHVGRIFPSAVIHFAATLLGADVSFPRAVLTAFQTYNAVVLTIGAKRTF